MYENRGQSKSWNRNNQSRSDPLTKGDMTNPLAFDDANGYNVGCASDHREISKKRPARGYPSIRQSPKDFKIMAMQLYRETGEK